MATRDILDSQGIVIGQMTLADDTSEEIWTEKLAPYASVLSGPTLESRIHAAETYGRALLRSIAAENISLGFTTDQIASMVESYQSIIIMLWSGSLYTAIQAISQIEPSDTMSQDRIDKYIKQIKDYLGIP